MRNWSSEILRKSISAPCWAWPGGLLLLQRVHRPGHDLPHGQRRHLFQSQCAQVSVPLLQKRPDPHQLRPYPVRVLCVLRSGQHHLHLEVHLPPLPGGVPCAVQHRGGPHPLRPVRLLPGYPVSLERVHPAIDVYVRHLLHHRQLFPHGAEPLPFEPCLPLHPLLPEDRHRGHHPQRLVPPADAGRCGHRAGHRVLGLQEV